MPESDKKYQAILRSERDALRLANRGMASALRKIASLECDTQRALGRRCSSSALCRTCLAFEALARHDK